MDFEFAEAKINKLKRKISPKKKTLRHPTHLTNQIQNPNHAISQLSTSLTAKYSNLSKTLSRGELELPNIQQPAICLCEFRSN